MKCILRKLGCVALSLLGVFCGIVPVGGAEENANRPAALFINVGKADSALFFVGEKTYLVDTGTKKSVEAILRALETYQVAHLDGLFITHTDKDHVGGLSGLLAAGLSVEKLYTPKIHDKKSDEKHPVYQASMEYGVPMEWLVAGDVLAIDGNHRFAVLGPLSPGEENNNNSLVMDLQTPHGNMLLTGDMEFPEEEELLAAGLIPPAIVLKVGNHGEADASSTAFVARVKPQWAVISTNTEEEKDTPSPRVMKLLWDVKAGVAVTQDATCGIYVTLWEGTASAEKIDYLP